MRTDREFLTDWGWNPGAEDSIRRSIMRLLKRTKGKLTMYERQYLTAALGHLAEKDATKP